MFVNKDQWNKHNFKGVEFIKDILHKFLNATFSRGNNVIKV